MQPIVGLRPGQTAAVSGEVLHCHLQHTRRTNFRLFTALVQDASGQIQVVWPNQAFLKDVIRPHQHIVLFGKVEIWGSRGLQITDPEFEIIESAPVADRDGDSAAPTPRRGLAHRPHRPGLRAHRQRHDEHAAPLRVAGPRQLPSRAVRSGARRAARARTAGRSAARALCAAHFPPRHADVEALNRFETPPQRRLIFEDFFVFQAGLALRRHENAQVRKARVCHVTDEIRAAARAVLPFKLTTGQRDALAEIVADMQRKLADAAAAAGRRRRGQDHRRGAGRGGRDGERLSRSPSWRRPRSWPSSTSAR